MSLYFLIVCINLPHGYLFFVMLHLSCCNTWIPEPILSCKWIQLDCKLCEGALVYQEPACMLHPTDFSYSHQECSVFWLILNVHSEATAIIIIVIIIIIINNNNNEDFYICTYLLIQPITMLHSFSKAWFIESKPTAMPSQNEVLLQSHLYVLSAYMEGLYLSR